MCCLVLEDISVSCDDCLFGAGLIDVMGMRSVYLLTSRSFVGYSISPELSSQISNSIAIPFYTRII